VLADDAHRHRRRATALLEERHEQVGRFHQLAPGAAGVVIRPASARLCRRGDTRACRGRSRAGCADALQAPGRCRADSARGRA
jgi:hypothetical protein